MTPSNPDNQNPLIYRICDSLGVFHIVAPVNHTHAQSEIEGLAAALAAKANAIPAGSPTGAIVVALTSGEIARSNKTITDLLNAIAAKQDALTFDTTPTAGSTNPVTSGGVKAALDEKMGIMSFDSVPTTGSNNLVKSGNIREALQYEGKIIPMTFNESLGSQAIENIVPWYRDGCVELHYLLMKTAGSAIPVKNLFHSNTCTTYYADDLGNLTITRWVAITIRKTVTGASTPVCVITLDGVITPS